MGWRPRGRGKGRSASPKPRAEARGRGACGRPRRGARDAADMACAKFKMKRITMRIVLDDPDMKEPYMIWPDGTIVWKQELYKCGRSAVNKEPAQVPERILESTWPVSDNGSEDWEEARDGGPAAAREESATSKMEESAPIRLKPNTTSKGKEEVSLSDSNCPYKKAKPDRQTRREAQQR